MKRLILSLVIRKLVTLLGKGFVRSSTVRCNLSLCVFATFCFQKFQVEAQSISTCHCIKDIYIYIFCFEYVGSVLHKMSFTQVVFFGQNRSTF